MTGDTGGSPVETMLNVGGKLLTVLGGGLGLLGFVTLVGAAILYAQMSALGLPSDQIVSATPQSDMLVVGGRFLIPWLAAVALGLVALSALDPRKPTHGDRLIARRLGTVALVAIGGTFVIADLGRTDASAWVWALVLGTDVALGVLIWTAGIHPRPRPRFHVFAAACTSAAAVFAVEFATTLASVAPAVRAVAIVRANEPPVVGIYAAANSTAVLVGQVCEQPLRGRRGAKVSGVLEVVPRRQIERMLITTNGSLDDALVRVPVLLRALGASAPAAPPGCTDQTPAMLRDIWPRIGRRPQGVPGILQGP